MTPGDLGLLILRVVIGLTFTAHGAQKAFGWWSGPKYAGWRAGVKRMGLRPADFWAFVSTAAELGGGVLLAAGLLTPLATAALIAQSVVIIGLVHLPNGFWNAKGGVEFPLSLAAGVAALAGNGTRVGVPRFGPRAVVLGGSPGLCSLSLRSSVQSSG
ncbi:MAG TPA: DoxX family protein [Candidatus Limnocylindrales bacterium]|jgi:putative oxidoreductase